MNCSSQVSPSFTISLSLLKLMSIESVMPSTISSSVVPFPSCPQSFPASGFFQMSQLFASGGQSTGVSASTSVLPMNIQGWFPLGWTGLVSSQSKGLSSILTRKWGEVAQLCPTLCDPMDCNLPGSSVHGIFQARVLEWVAISFSRGSFWLRDWTQVSHIAGRLYRLSHQGSLTCHNISQIRKIQGVYSPKKILFICDSRSPSKCYKHMLEIIIHFCEWNTVSFFDEISPLKKVVRKVYNLTFNLIWEKVLLEAFQVMLFKRAQGYQFG